MEERNRRSATVEEIKIVEDKHGIPGEIEIDPDAQVSESENGIWVQGWLWDDQSELK